VERAGSKRHREDVGLGQVNVRALADVAIRGVDRRREVDAEHLRTLGCGLFREPTGADARIEQTSIVILLVRPPGRRVEHLLRSLAAGPRAELPRPQPVPLMAERPGVGAAGNNPRDTPCDGVRGPPPAADQATVDDFGAPLRADAKVEAPLAFRADED